MNNSLKYFLFILISALLTPSIAQPLLTDLQKFSPETIKKNHIKQITSYEKPYNKPFYDYNAIIIPDTIMLAEVGELGVRQSLEEYDTLGRIIHRKNYWEYSDAGLVSQKYLWDTQHKINTIEHYKDSVLERKEEFFYDMVGNMILWKVAVYAESFILFKKYENNKYGHPVKIKIFIGQDLVRADSIAYTYDNQGRITKERGFDMYKSNMDSISYIYHMGDTTFLQEIFVGGKRDKTNLHKTNNIYETKKRTSFSDGDFMGSSYSIFNKEGNITKEKSIHHYSQLNYTKEYIYSPNHVPLVKRIYKNKEEPDVLVTFDIELYPDGSAPTQN